MVRPPGIEPDRVRQGGKACKLNDPRQSKRTPRPNGRPHEKAPGQWGPARELGCCRGTCPPPAAGCMVTAFALDQKSRRRRGAPPPAALDGISIARFFGSKVQCSEQAEIFCDLPDKIPMPLLCRPLRYAER